MEPMPTRLASIAMGTGDMDCVYHAALYELEEAAAERGNENQGLKIVDTISLKRGIWKYDQENLLGREGGFGSVYSGLSEGGEQVAVKRLNISAQAAAHRELIIVDSLIGKTYSNVIPILDCGQDAQSDRYFVVMPCAERSLQDLIDEKGRLAERLAMEILLQIIIGLGEVSELVHRDLKPGNILLHEENWKIADFGIARFVEESTSLRTVKECLSPLYAAPEQWRLEHATPETDIYALGCIGYTLLTGNPPFAGPTSPDLKKQHLDEEPMGIGGINPTLQSLLSMMLRKVPRTRPSLQRAKEILTSLLRNGTGRGSSLDALAQAGSEVAQKEQRKQAIEQQALSQRQDRSVLASAALNILSASVSELFRRISDAAPSSERKAKFRIGLGDADLEILHMRQNPIDRSAFHESGWDVVAGAIISVAQRSPRYGRSASLWYCRQTEKDEYRWQEVSYFSVFRREPSRELRYAPYYLDDLTEADQAAAKMVAVDGIVFGPVPIDDEDAEAFYERWAALFAEAARGQLRPPSRLPLQ